MWTLKHPDSEATGGELLLNFTRGPSGRSLVQDIRAFLSFLYFVLCSFLYFLIGSHLLCVGRGKTNDHVTPVWAGPSETPLLLCFLLPFLCSALKCECHCLRLGHSVRTTGRKNPLAVLGSCKLGAKLPVSDLALTAIRFFS